MEKLAVETCCSISARAFFQTSYIVVLTSFVLIIIARNGGFSTGILWEFYVVICGCENRLGIFHNLEFSLKICGKVVEKCGKMSYTIIRI